MSWNYNYGMFSNALYGDSSILLNNPELVADTWLNFASALWFFVTPQPPKPSMLEIVTGDWVPNGADIRGFQPYILPLYFNLFRQHISWVRSHYHGDQRSNGVWSQSTQHQWQQEQTELLQTVHKLLQPVHW